MIADLGAGTGMLTRHFIDRVGQIFAVEPNDDMRAQAAADLRHCKSLRVIAGTAHATGLPDRSVHAVIVGRAIQWFDPVPSQAEIHRILRPGGWLIVLRTPTTDDFSIAALERLRDERISRHQRNRRHHQPRSDVADYFGGDNYIRLAYPASARETWPQFLGRLHSLSFVPQQGDAIYDEFERTARGIFDEGAVDGLLHGRYETELLMKQMTPPESAVRQLPFPESAIEGDVVARFEEIVAAVPDTVAIRAGDEECTYARLDALANAIATIVLRESPDRSKPVALLFDHGCGGVVSMMGVLKAGRTYCAISPSHPARSQRETLVDVQAALLLCAPSQVELAQAYALPELRCIAIDPSAMQGTDQRRRFTRTADDVAAIYFTSGTTGKAKGALLSHRYLLHRAWVSGRIMGVAPGDRISQFAEISVATAATDIFVALLAGATLCPFDARQRSLTELKAWLNGDRIAIVRMAVALFHQLLDSLDDSDRFPHVRFMQPAGKVHWSTVDRYRRHFPRQCRLVRQLAATETSLVATMMVDHDTPRHGATVPVGYPVPGKEVWLEGEDGKRVDKDAIGEIVIRSRYLLSGYWQQPQTLGRTGEARVYRMGDFARWLDDGSLEFVGRVDSRVKVRGYTVDLEMVESAIGDTGLVVDATVAAVEDAVHGTHLVAYVVPVSPSALSDIRARLTECVPVYMIPAHFVALDALPLTPTGKIDRAALPAPRRARPEATGAVAPRTALEASVCAIWCDVFALDAIGVDDDFLEIGGDSLVAVRIANRILAEFKVDLAPGDLFDAPTIAGMAAAIARRQGISGDTKSR